jgi:hypothetical protein
MFKKEKSSDRVVLVWLLPWPMPGRSTRIHPPTWIWFLHARARLSPSLFLSYSLSRARSLSLSVCLSAAVPIRPVYVTLLHSSL